MKIRQWQINVRAVGASFRDPYTTFEFVAENKQLAFDHAETLKDDPDFRLRVGQPLVTTVNERIRDLSVRFIGWVNNDE